MSNELAITDPPQADSLRSRLMSLTVEQQNSILTEYEARRKNFRDWLMSNMVEGVHYGYPPGCKPIIDPDTGDALVSQKNKQGQWEKIRVSAKQWQSKPSLYEAGADLLIDLLFMRSEFPAANDVIQQLGNVPGRMVFRCILFDQHGKILGEGLGGSHCDDVGKRNGQGLNLALKLSKKRAKVDAVKNTLGISDLFTQDIEDDVPPAAEPPKQKHDAPETQPRAERVTADEIAALAERWKKLNPQGELTNDQWRAAWSDCCRRNGGPRVLKDAGSWNREHVRAVDAFLKLQGG